MSKIEEAIGLIKQAGFDLTLTELARRAGVKKSTARDLLKNPPGAVNNLIAMEREATKHLEEKASSSAS